MRRTAKGSPVPAKPTLPERKTASPERGGPPSFSLPERPRRLRRHPWIRELAQEHRVTASDLIYPVFVVEGRRVRQPVPSMPGVSRVSADVLVEIGKECRDLGIPALAVFPVIDAKYKDLLGSHALSPDGLACRTAQALKKAVPELGLIGDIALDPYTSHGQDGILEDGYVVNDRTVEQLAKMAVVHAQAGFDIVAPSDMMDGRVGQIRARLDEHELTDTAILAYAAKYASAFYGPFRDAVGSKSALGKADKASYQMNPANVREARRELMLDEFEGADMLMVKPGMPYLDVVRLARELTALPVAAYQVSGEYAMLKAAAERGWLDYDAVLAESLVAFKRAGADAILTYAALDYAKKLAKR
jgi:porphobilinogen synthase